MSAGGRESGAPRPLPELPADAHKGTAGRALCVAGSRAMPGAAVLVARAAQRAGAGLVSMACLDPSLLSVLPVAAPEAVLVEAYDELLLSAEHSVDTLLDLRSSHARLVGPGLGDDERARFLVRGLLASDFAGPLALDADALNALDGEPERVQAAGGPVVLTPHPGEAARLAGLSPADMPRDDGGRGELARGLAARSGAVVCLKGRRTVVTDGERLYHNETGNAGMATAGSGDVLSGILVGYLARAAAARSELDALELARLAVHVHGRAGDLAASELGPSAVVASDLIRFLPAAQRGLA
ncbi:MAG: NAD(P)H-hydrate dehydratase [Planctomycetota bacterium]